MTAIPDGIDLNPQPLANAHALPGVAYADPVMIGIEQQRVFGRSWQLLGHVCQIPESGDHRVLDGGGPPLLLVRGDDGAIRVFHNVCRHRAGPIALCDGRGAKSLRCRYHGWNYGLDGRLRAATEMSDAEDFDVSSIGLVPLDVEIWNGLIFAATDRSSAPPFKDFVAGIGERMGPSHDIARYGHPHHTRYEIDCNWKVYVDNYLEGYHVPHVHPALNRMLDYRSYVTEIFDWHNLQWSPMESGSGLYGDGDALYYWLWPNTMLNILPGRLQTNRVVPLGVDRCRVEFDFFYPQDDSDEAAARRQADLEFSDEVQVEDIDICLAVQRGLASGHYIPGRLNPKRESGVHHFHELLRRAWRGDRSIGVTIE